MGTGFGKIMKQLKKMRENVARVEEELEGTVCEGSAGGGAVKATVDASGMLVSIKIEPEVVKSGDVEMLEDLVLMAVNQAVHDVTELHERELKKAAGESGVPKMLGLDW